jgi:phosphatidate cytidylyltransferase
MNPLGTRIASAIVAFSFLVSLIYFFGDNGLKVICCLAPILAQRELVRLLFKDSDSAFLKWSFSVVLLIIFFGSAFFPDKAASILALMTVLFCSLTLFYEKFFHELNDVVLFQAKSLLGFLYVGLLPAIAFQLILLPMGNFWFLTMLAAVLFSDTFAYIFGINFGKTKLSPRLSPKKTVEGSIGGLLGSALAGLISSLYFLTTPPTTLLLILCVLTGFIAQQGDLFESLLKRIANRKDSGSIMPGHGGILDRIDGILFGAPVMLAGAMLLQLL